MSRIFLILLGLATGLMGVLALFPSIEIGTEPLWHAVAKIIIGIAAVVVGFMDKPKKTVVEEETIVEETEKPKDQ